MGESNVSVANVTVNFQIKTIGKDHTIQIELDAERMAEVEDMVSASPFPFGQDVFFRIFTSPLDMSLKIVTSDGDFALDGTGGTWEPVTPEWVVFSELTANDPEKINEASVSKAMTGSPTIDFYGKNQNYGTVNPVLNSTKIWVSKPGIFVATVDYESAYRGATLSGVSQPDGLPIDADDNTVPYQVVIYLIEEAEETP